jgi:hypothetical protein
VGACGQSDAGIGGEVAKPPGGGVPVHASAAPIEQQCPGCSVTSGSIDGAADRWRQRNEDDLATLAADPENAVTMLFSEVVNVGADGLEDPRPEQAEQAHQREIQGAARLPGGGQHCLELQVGQSERRRLRRDSRSSDVVSWGVLEDAVDGAGPVEAGDDGQTPGDRGGLEPADLLHPPQV